VFQVAWQECIDLAAIYPFFSREPNPVCSISDQLSLLLYLHIVLSLQRLKVA
jgi:hypothetical protein